MAVKWIIDAYLSTQQSQSKNIVLVPVMISYDRIFEKKNFTTEMINGKKDKLYTRTDFVNTFRNLTSNVYGNVFVKYLEPIHLQSYFKNSGFESMNELQIQKASFKLTPYLY